MYASIKFDKEAHFQSRGRNGYLNTHGVAVYNMGIGEFEGSPPAPYHLPRGSQ